MYKKVIVPLDMSQTAENILPYVRQVASPQGSQIVLVSSIELHTYSFATLSDNPQVYEQLLQSMTNSTTEYLGNIQSTLQNEGYDVKSRVSHENAAQFILDAAIEEAADLIAMTTHGRRGFARWALGSVADRVVRSAHIPVFLLRNEVDERPTKELQKILIPLDGSSIAEQALEEAEEIAQATGATLILLRVLEPLTKWERQILFDTTQSPDSITIQRSDEARGYLNLVSRRLSERGIRTVEKLYTGSPSSSILDVAEAEKVDLIAMSTHGRGGYTRWVLGSVASQVLHGAQCPLMVVRGAYDEIEGTPLAKRAIMPVAAL